MLTQLNQPKGSTSVLINMASIARNFGVADTEVCYAKPGQSLDGYKVIYDKDSHRAYSLPALLGTDLTVVSFSAAGVLTVASGPIDLGALAVTRNEYVTLPGSFISGATLTVRNDVLTSDGIQYRWAGTLPKVVTAGQTPDNSGGISPTAWVPVRNLSAVSVNYKPNYTGSVSRTQQDVNSESVSVKDFGAKGDGSTDDTAAIQACFTWAASQSRGVTVKVPPGSYILSSQITWEGGNSQIFLVSENSGNTFFNWTQASASQGLKGGLTTPISRFSARGITFVTNAVSSSACIQVNFNKSSPKSLIMVDCSGYGGAVGGTASNGYWGDGLLVTKDPVYPIFEHCYFFGIGGATSVAKSNLIQSAFRITSSGGVFFSNFRNCFANNVNNGVWLQSTSSPGIEGTFIESCNFNSCNVGVSADGSLSGAGDYYPPQVFINNSQIEYIQRAVGINHHSKVDIRGCLFYADPTADVAVTHVLLTNVNSAIITDNYMESRPIHTGVDGVVINGNSSYVQVKNNQIQIPTGHYAIVFSDSSNNCKHSGNTVLGGSLCANISSSAATNTQDAYNANGQLSTNLPDGTIMKAGSSIVTTTTGGAFSLNFTSPLPTANLTVVACNGDNGAGAYEVRLTAKSLTGFTGVCVGAASGLSLRVNWTALGT